MNVGIIIQARLGSTRLPRKILKEFYTGKTLLETVISNLQKVAGAKIIVATSVNPNNDELESFLKERGITVFRGSENDVLSRFIGAAEENEVDGIVRICSDNPFLDWHGVADLIVKAKNSDADYMGYRINNTPSIKTHFGFWGEFVTLNALKRVAATTEEKTAHEHVTIHIYTHPDDYKCEWIECPAFLQGRNDIRLTVDNIEDFENAQKAYSTLYEANPDFGLEDVVKYIDANDDLRESMKKMIENNQK
jgi:spore coat polysaccharide biosynthesis protein SpsF